MGDVAARLAEVRIGPVAAAPRARPGRRRAARRCGRTPAAVADAVSGRRPPALRADGRRSAGAAPAATPRKPRSQNGPIGSRPADVRWRSRDAATFQWDGEEITLRAVPDVVARRRAGPLLRIAAARGPARRSRPRPGPAADADRAARCERPRAGGRLGSRALRRPRSAVDSAGAAARPRRDRARGARRLSAGGVGDRHPGRSPHAYVVERRPRHAPRRSSARPAPLAIATSPSPITRRRRRRAARCRSKASPSRPGRSRRFVRPTPN